MGLGECVNMEPAGSRRYLLRRPKALQYFHNGELRKASEGERQAGRFELFLDLLCKYFLSFSGLGDTAVLGWIYRCNHHRRLCVYELWDFRMGIVGVS